MVVENCSGKSVDYKIHVGIDYAKVVDLQSKWGAYRADLLSALITANPGMATDNELARKILADNSLSDWHWDWCRKLLQCNSDDYQWFFGRDADLVVMIDRQIPSDDLIVHFF